MDKQENNCKNKEKMNKRSCHVEYDERADPGKEQEQREGKKYESHESVPSVGPWAKINAGGAGGI